MRKTEGTKEVDKVGALLREIVKEKEKNLPDVLPGIYALDGSKSVHFIRGLQDTTTLENENVWLRYGKHAESISMQIKDGRIINEDMQYALYCPVAFVFDMSKVPMIKSYPFDPDTVRDKYGEIELMQYELGEDLTNIQKYISKAYGSNEKYWNEHIVSENVKEVMEFIEICNIQKCGFDEKLCTISMLVEKIKLLKSSLEYVVVPDKIFNFKEFKVLESSNEFKIGFYKTHVTRHPSRYNEVVDDMCRAYIENKRTMGTKECKNLNYVVL